MEVKMMIQFNGKRLTLPINPEQLTISQSANNDNIDIIGLGPVTRKGVPELEKLKIESFFPGANSFFYTGVQPKTCIEFIKEIWNTENKNNNVAKLVITGLPISYDWYFVIEDFDYDHRAGEEDDIYYELSIKKYVPYGAKIVNVQLSGLAAARASALAAAQTSKTSGTSGTGTGNNYYVVKSGDSLWSITKSSTGDGSKWKELYNLNKSVIGSNPNLIKPGQKLLLPSGWKTPNTSGSSKSSRSSSSNKSVATSKRAADIASNIKNPAAEKEKATAKAIENAWETVKASVAKALGGSGTSGGSKGGGFR